MQKYKKIFVYALLFFCIVSIVNELLIFVRNFYQLSRIEETEHTISDYKSLAENEHILFLSSYASHDFESEIQYNVLNKYLSEKKFFVDAEYLDSRRINYYEYEEFFYSYLKSKQNELPFKYKTIVASGDVALEFCIKFQDDLFANIPIVFIDVKNPVLVNIANSRNNMIGNLESINIDKIVNVASRLFPKSKRFLIITDDQIEQIGIQAQILMYQDSFSNYELEIYDTSKVKYEDYKKKLQALNENYIVYFSSAKNFSNYTEPSSGTQANTVLSLTNIPVFSIINPEYRRGFIGGCITDYEKIAKDAIAPILSATAGKNINYIKFESDNSYKWEFSLNVLNKYKVKKDLLPEGSILIQSDKNLIFSKNNYIYRFIIIGISLLSLFVIILLLFIRERKNLMKLKQTHSALKFVSDHDVLTHLQSRQVANSIFVQLQKSKKPFAIILIDIDDFKNVNDYYSHLCGDYILKELGKRFIDLSKDGKFYVYRFGGDEFLLFYTHGHLNSYIEDYEKVENIFKEPFIYNQDKIYIKASFGIVNSNEKYTTLDEYISNADLSMYNSKRCGKNKITIFEESLKNAASNKQEITLILENAIKTNSFTVLYQPQINALTKQIEGYEALVRLKESNISPGQFIPVAEETGLIVQIARFVTEEVVRQISEWKRNGIPLYKVGINYSYGQSHDENYVKYLKNLLEVYDIAPELIGVEITESLFIDNKEKSMQLFKDFNSLGITLSLDDFGTGYSSLSYLTFLPIEKVKIDKSLVDNYLNKERSLFIKNIVNLVHSLDLKLVVEGVESAEQYELLKEYQCDVIQGYFFSRPITGKDVETYKPA